MVDPSTIPTITAQTINKISDVNLITLQEVTAAPRIVISAELPTTNLSSVSIMIHLGRLTTTAFTSGVNFRIETSTKSSGNGHWYPITLFTSPLGSSIATEAVSAAAAAGQAVIPMADTTGFAVGDIVYIDNPTTANSEFGRVAVVTTNTSITLEDNLLFAQTTSTVFDQAEMYYALINTDSFERLRVVVDGSGAAQNFAVEVDADVGA